VQFIRTDISDEQQVQDMVALALKTFGRLDGAFNNAGVAGFNQSNLGADEPAKFSALPLDVYRRVQEVNVVGTFICMKHEIIAMLQTGGGAIVNTASFSGIFASPGAADYVASKHAVIGLTKSAALDYATQNIRVNAVLPGAIRTPMLDMVFKSDGRNKLLAAAHPNGRLGEPEEIAQAALWLLSDAASLITGISMSADGGLSMI
jgi:2,5-dichloro-2,5-cyclohexadiene-1,4-diol dehydrogenase 1